MRSYPRPETRVLCLKSYAMMLTLITLWRRVRTDWVDNSLGIYLFLAYSACETCICVAFTIQSNAEQREHNNNVTVALYQDTQCANGGYTASVECERQMSARILKEHKNILNDPCACVRSLIENEYTISSYIYFRSDDFFYSIGYFREPYATESEPYFGCSAVGPSCTRAKSEHFYSIYIAR